MGIMAKNERTTVSARSQDALFALVCGHELKGWRKRGPIQRVRRKDEDGQWVETYHQVMGREVAEAENTA